MGSECILIVEAELAIRHPLAQYLRECGYKVFEATDTDEGIAVLVTEDLKVDAVLVDVESAGSLDGFGLSRWIRTRGLPTKVILAGTLERVAEKAGELCEEGPLLGKPYHPQTLVKRIKRLLESGAPKAGPADTQ